jgi:hypothetical protein
MTIEKEIGVCVGGMIALCVVIGATSWLSVSALGRRLDQSVSVTTRKIELAGELEANALAFRLQERGMLMYSLIDAPSDG